jgi:hypothetical protein
MGRVSLTQGQARLRGQAASEKQKPPEDAAALAL